jgi:hypothetical protein
VRRAIHEGSTAGQRLDGLDPGRRGADGLKNLEQAAVTSEPRSILDWYHISMRLRPIEQMASKVAVALDDGEPNMAALVRQRLPNVRHQMWNGQWRPAIARMKTIYQEQPRG